MHSNKLDFQWPHAEEISEERRLAIKQCAKTILDGIDQHGNVNLIFVCTHNSRRSQACELWAHTWIHHLRVENIKVYSAGTEKTSYNYRMIDAVRRWGFRAEMIGDNDENYYQIHSPLADDKGKKYFSKTIHDKSLPKKNVIAIMTCDHAEENCPLVPGAIARIPLRYTDPSEFDDANNEGDYYDKTFREIGKEIGCLIDLL